MRRTTYRRRARVRLRRVVAGAAGLIVLVVAVTLAVIGTLSHTSPRDDQFAAAPVPSTKTAGAGPGAHTTTTPTTTGPTTPAAPPLAAPGVRPPATPADVRLQTTLTKSLSRAGPQSGSVVYDLTARVELYALRPLVARAPASVEKLWTTTAALLKLGPDARFATTILGRGFQRGGVWHGNLYLRGGGDPTFGDQTFNAYWNHGQGPTPNQLVAQLLRRGIHRVTGLVYPDESLFDRRRGGLMTNYLADVPDFGGQLSALTYDHGSIVKGYSPATFAAHELALTMRGSGIRVRAASHDADTPRRARVLATVTSPPLLALTRLMDVPSDDLFAEVLTKQLGMRFGGGGTIPAGARVIERTIAEAYGLHPRILDGSGLGRGDRSSPEQIVQLLRAVYGTQVGQELVDSLPTVGRQGTVQGIGVKTAAAGHCVAKTGTLNYVTNLVGYCRAKTNGHMLAFATFIDGPDNGAATVLQSRAIAAIARY